MIKNIMNLLLHSFEWMKRDLIILSCMLIILGLISRFSEMNKVLEMILVIILLIKCFVFARLYSINGGMVDQFSWKFFQGLPLTKKELIISLTLSDLSIFFPTFLWIICFWNHIASYVDQEVFSLGKVLILMIFFFIWMGLNGINNQIQNPRKEYQKNNADKQFIKFLGSALLILTVLTYSMIGVSYIDETFNINLILLFFKGISKGLSILLSWWCIPIFTTGVVAYYFYILKVWSNEKMSYRPNMWNAKKEYSQIVFTCGLLFLAFINIDFKMPGVYKGKLTKAVFQKDYNLIEKSLNNHENINSPNRFGATPMLVAIAEGDLEMVKYLETKGGSFDGSIKYNKPKSAGDSAVILAIESKNLEMLKYVLSKKNDSLEYYKKLGYGAIHKASSTCQARLVDYLVKNGSDVNALNENGETPLLVSVRFNCFSVAVTLREVGADFQKNNKDGKSVLELFKKNYKKDAEFEYFLEKNSRVPASAK